MLSESEIKKIVDEVFAYSKADQTAVLLSAEDSALTRFANNEISQNVAETNVSIAVEVVFDKKKGVASINNVSSHAIRKVVDWATTIAHFQVENPDFRSLPKGVPAPRVNAFVERTAKFAPDMRARGVAIVCNKAKGQGLLAAGAFSNSASQLAVANSLGVFQHMAETTAELETVIMSDTSSGYADRLALDVGDIDVEAIATEAIDKAVKGRNPIDLQPGEYTVILDQYAVSDILDFFAYLSFGALAVEEKRSFMAGKFGQQVMAPSISIWDDGLSPQTIPMPFDFQGVPKQRVDFIVNGVANAVCYDWETAQREGKQDTGHGLPPGDTFGPIPMNMFLEPGDATEEEMIRSTQRGIWVTRFHYTRQVLPLNVVVTGMTRDGTFLVENGEIARPIKNLRFTQSYLDAFNKVEMIGRDTILHRELFPYNRVPALKIGSWNFVSATEY